MDISMGKMDVDYSIYLITDRELMSTKTLEEAVELSILGGCTVVQLREKNISSLEFYKIAISIKKITDKYHIPFIINDRIDIAIAVDCAGVHVGQNDIPAYKTRELIGKDKILGVSVSSTEEAVQAQADGADYLGVGAMYRTNTKQDAKIVERIELENIREIVKLPIVVIGGINEQTIPDFAGIEIDGLAIISAILSSKDIKSSTENIKKQFKGAQRT